MKLELLKANDIIEEQYYDFLNDLERNHEVIEDGELTQRYWVEL